MGNNKRAGGTFERDICKMFGQWWARRDDVFWRTATSGGRATVRSKQGKKTSGQHGDMCATDPIGNPLVRLIAVEAKKGYSTKTIADLLDRTIPQCAQQHFETIILQAMKSHRDGNTYTWMLVIKRNRSEIWCYFPVKFMVELHGMGVDLKCASSWMQSQVRIRDKKKKGRMGIKVSLFAIPLEEFFRLVSKQDIKDIYKEWKSAK